MSKRRPGASLLTIADLTRDGVMTIDEVRRAAENYLSGSAPCVFCFSSGHVIDVGTAVSEHAACAAALADANLHIRYRRTLVRLAILLYIPAHLDL